MLKARRRYQSMLNSPMLGNPSPNLFTLKPFFPQKHFPLPASRRLITLWGLTVAGIATATILVGWLTKDVPLQSLRRG
jgi:hypothetical protein